MLENVYYNSIWPKNSFPFHSWNVIKTLGLIWLLNRLLSSIVLSRKSKVEDFSNQINFIYILESHGNNGFNNLLSHVHWSGKKKKTQLSTGLHVIFANFRLVIFSLLTFKYTKSLPPPENKKIAQYFLDNEFSLHKLT